MMNDNVLFKIRLGASTLAFCLALAGAIAGWNEYLFLGAKDWHHLLVVGMLLPLQLALGLFLNSTATIAALFPMSIFVMGEHLSVAAMINNYNVPVPPVPGGQVACTALQLLAAFLVLGAIPFFPGKPSFENRAAAALGLAGFAFVLIGFFILCANSDTQPKSFPIYVGGLFTAIILLYGALSHDIEKSPLLYITGAIAGAFYWFQFFNQALTFSAIEQPDDAMTAAASLHVLGLAMLLSALGSAFNFAAGQSSLKSSFAEAMVDRKNRVFAVGLVTFMSFIFAIVGWVGIGKMIDSSEEATADVAKRLASLTCVINGLVLGPLALAALATESPFVYAVFAGLAVAGCSAAFLYAFEIGKLCRLIDLDTYEIDGAKTTEVAFCFHIITTVLLFLLAAKPPQGPGSVSNGKVSGYAQASIMAIGLFMLLVLPNIAPSEINYAIPWGEGSVASIAVQLQLGLGTYTTWGEGIAALCSLAATVKYGFSRKVAAAGIFFGVNFILDASLVAVKLNDFLDSVNTSFVVGTAVDDSLENAFYAGWIMALVAGASLLAKTSRTLRQEQESDSNFSGSGAAYGAFNNE